MKKRKFRHWLIIFIAAMLVNDIIQVILAYRAYRRKLRKEAIARLRRNRRRAEKRRWLKGSA